MVSLSEGMKGGTGALLGGNGLKSVSQVGIGSGKSAHSEGSPSGGKTLPVWETLFSG